MELQITEVINKKLDQLSAVHAIVSFGTNDATDIRESYADTYIVKRYLDAVQLLSKKVLVHLLKSPPKRCPRLNSKLERIWALLTSQVDNDPKLSYIRMHEIEYDQKKHLGPDGVHLSPAGIRLLTGFLNTHRFPLFKPAFYHEEIFSEPQRNGEYQVTSSLTMQEQSTQTEPIKTLIPSRKRAQNLQDGQEEPLHASVPKRFRQPIEGYILDETIFVVTSELE